MEAFMDYIRQFARLSKQQADLIAGKASVLVLRKDELYWEAGKRVDRVGFLSEGVIRVYYYNQNGEEITRYFIDENHLILSGHTIEERYTPSEYLAAVTDCTLTVFSKQGWKEIADAIVGWDALLQQITAGYHREKIACRSGLVSLDARARYLDFIEQFPALANRVPLSYIASYLGITPSSLSRIRKNIR